jgi:hypothetical protein
VGMPQARMRTKSAGRPVLPPHLVQDKSVRARHHSAIHVRSTETGSGVDVGAEQCGWYGPVAGAALSAAAARHARMLRWPNCKVNLDNFRWNRPDLYCEPQQAEGYLAIFVCTRQKKPWPPHRTHTMKRGTQWP